MKILFAPEVRIYLKELSEILYKKEYFGFENDAYDYVEELILEINSSLSNKLKKKAPEYSSKYGKGLLYAVLKKKDKLYNPEKSVNEVAYELGFKYPHHFSRMFKKVVGSSPTDYRMMN